jgi:hypothetical protein
MIREIETFKQVVLFDIGNLTVFIALKSTDLQELLLDGCKGIIIGVHRKTENLKG